MNEQEQKDASDSPKTKASPLEPQIKDLEVEVKIHQENLKGILNKLNALSHIATLQEEEREKKEQTLRKELEKTQEELLNVLTKYQEVLLGTSSSLQSTNESLLKTNERLLNELTEVGKRLDELKAQNPPQPPPAPGPSATTVVAGAIVLLLLIGIAWWGGKNSSHPNSKIASSREMTTGEMRPVIANSPVTDSLVTKKYREHTDSPSPVRVLSTFSIGNKHIANICEKDGSGFTLKQISFEGERIIAVSPPLDPFGDGRQSRGFPPCVIPMT